MMNAQREARRASYRNLAFARQGDRRAHWKMLLDRFGNEDLHDPRVRILFLKMGSLYARFKEQFPDYTFSDFMAALRESARKEKTTT